MFEVEEMEGCHSCKYGEKFDTDKEPCKYCYGLSLYTKGGKSMTVDETIMQATLLKFTELTAEAIEHDYCPRCKYYIDKQFIYKDENIKITMGTVKECKFCTDTSWICDFKEVEEWDATQ